MEEPRDNRGQKNEQSEYLLRPQLFIPTVPVYVKVGTAVPLEFEKKISAIHTVVKELRSELFCHHPVQVN